MKKYVLMLMLIFTTVSYSDSHVELEFWGQFSLAPTKFVDANGQLTGIAYDIIKEIDERNDFSIKIKNVPWKRLINGVKIGSVEGGFSAYDTEERRQFAHYFSVPLQYGQYVVFVKKGKEFKFNSPDDFKGKSVGRNLGFFITKEVEDKIKRGEINLQEGRDTVSNFKKLLADRIDAYMMTELEGLYTAKQLGILDKIEILPQKLGERKAAYLILSKKAKIPNKQNVIDAIEKTLVEMEKDGTISKINDKYTK